jgi:hypothetical protein
VEDLRRGRLHACAQASRQDDGGRAPGLGGHGRGRGLGTWRVHARRRACAGSLPPLHPMPDGRKGRVIAWSAGWYGRPVRASSERPSRCRCPMMPRAGVRWPRSRP